MEKSRAEQRNQGRNKTTKNEQKKKEDKVEEDANFFSFSSASFQDIWDLEMIHNKLKSWTEVLWNR